MFMIKVRQAPVRLLSFIALSLMVFGVSAGEVEDSIAAKLQKAIPRLDVTGVTKSEAEGLYEVSTSNGGTVFATKDGQYLLTGDMLKITPQGVANLSEEKRLTERADAIADLGREGAITYPATGEEKSRIAVFTDIDCPYCRKFHEEVPKLNELGVTVDYFGFPRSGPNTPSFSKYVSVWCAEDQQAAMDDAKQGRSVSRGTCENPVGAQYNLGRQVGVTGTPATVLENGQIVPGYRPAEKMAEVLELL